MRILLLNLPWRKDNRWGVRAGSRWPFTSETEENSYIKYIPFPFFLAYAASLLKSKNKDVKIIDAIAQGSNELEILNEISAVCPGLIVIETSTPSFDNDLKLASEIKQRTLNSQIALCGPHATTYAKDILNKHSFVDYVLMGEYEYTLLDLVNNLESSLGLQSVLGLAYRKAKNILINKPRPTIGRLDDLPWPERESLFIYKYNDGFARLPVPNVQMWSSRGCPFKCMFCLWPQAVYGEHKYRKRNPLDVVDEMEWLIKKYNFKAVYFDDDVFNIDKAHVVSICKQIKQRGIKVPWAAMARADFMDEGMLSLLASAGLYAIKYGIESANLQVLELCKKKLNLAKAKKMIAYTKKIGIKVHLTFCLGLPGETKQSVQDSVDFIAVTQPDSLQFSLATPFPGTEYFKYLKKQGYPLPQSWADYDSDNRYIYGTQELNNLDLERLKRDLCSHLNFK